MGYRSEVTILIYGREDRMAALVAAERMRGNASPLTFDKDEVVTRTLNYTLAADPIVLVLAEFSGVKWYDNFPEVAAWAKLISDLGDRYDDDSQDNIEWEFVRVGEEATDISEEYSPGAEYWITASAAISNSAPES